MYGPDSIQGIGAVVIFERVESVMDAGSTETWDSLLRHIEIRRRAVDGDTVAGVQ